MNVILQIHIVTCIFITENVRVFLNFATKEIVYRGFLEFVANAHGSWIV